MDIITQNKQRLRMLYLKAAVAVCMIVFCCFIVTKLSQACSEAVCASIVSKCLLQEHCKCQNITAKNSCCKDCFFCLNYLYDECCSCVNLCPKANVTKSPLGLHSHVADLSQPVPVLFEALTSVPDSLNRWVSLTYPVDYYIISPNNEVKYFLKMTKEELKQNAQNSDIETLNCTVAFMTECQSWNKCKLSCQSMGATSFRWFHDACCECVGHTCINYGVSESRCKNCPSSRDDDLVEEFDDYGQDEDDDVPEYEFNFETNLLKD